MKLETIFGAIIALCILGCIVIFAYSVVEMAKKEPLNCPKPVCTEEETIVPMWIGSSMVLIPQTSTNCICPEKQND